jgi:hypothetical protein
MRDLFNNIAVQQATSPATATNTVTSATIDMQGYNSLAVLFAIGNSGDTLSGSQLWTLKLQHSDIDGSFADVTAADLLGGMTTVVIDDPAKDDTVVKFGYIGSKRYLKAVATKTGTHTNGTPIGILAVKGNANLSPVS